TGYGAEYFETLIKGSLLTNSHRVTLILKPKQEKIASLANEDLDAMRRDLSEAELQDIAARTARLRTFHETPDPPTMLRRLSFVTREDLHRAIAVTPHQEIMAGETRIFRHNLATPRITYLDVGFDLRSLAAAHLPYVRIFGRALLETGTKS